ncbi:50S ribosomal protein L5 [Candidatus Woesearchaeota archaeon]|nr:50S ribosomal protein L5 [Candidatus Woesearchaeota archaeon]
MKNNRNRDIRVEKLTLNIGAGKDQDRLEKGMQLLKSITGLEPVKTSTSKRIPGWGLRPGLPIGCKLTVRKGQAEEILSRLLDAKSFVLQEKQFDQYGNLSFGIPEYIDIKGVKYDPKIGIIGLEVCVTLERNGFRIKKRRLQKRKLNKRHMISRAEAMEFMKNKFNVKIGEEE